MALPEPGRQWPPRDSRKLARYYETNRAWWVGDPDLLATVATAHTQPATTGQSGIFRRLFWGRQAQAQAGQTARTALHVPLAATIAATSATQLYASPPSITSAVPEVADRLADYATAGLHPALMEGAELGAVYGGRYHVATLIPGVNGGLPFLEPVDPANVYPEFTWGHLTSANIVTTLETTVTGVLRHVERHELDTAGNGIVFHGLYRGTRESLGRPIPITEHPSTEHLADHLNDDGQTIGTPTPGLNIFYVPNRLPQRLFRDMPGARYLGRSDYDGLHSMLDALDEAWTSWMRDLRLGKSRLLVARQLLEPGGSGGPHVFDMEREVLTLLENVLPSDDGTLPLEKIQFDIRVAEHQQTVQELTSEILRSAGYSPSTYGYQLEGYGVTATEVLAREKHTLTTRGQKINHEIPFLQTALSKLIDLHMQADGRSMIDDKQISVEFPATVQESLSERAGIVGKMMAANAASTHMRVAYLHPEWTPEQVQAEVDAIKGEDGIPLDFPETYSPGV